MIYVIAGVTDTAVFDDKILAFGESELAQFGKEDLITWPRDRIVEAWTQNTDTTPVAHAPRRATPPPRRREAWLRIFVVECSLPCDPPVGVIHAMGMIPRFHRAVCA